MRGPKVVLTASGMATGGRVLHHLVQYLGITATWWRNDRLPGARHARRGAGNNGCDTLRIHGQDLPVRAEVVQLPDGLRRMPMRASS